MLETHDRFVIYLQVIIICRRFFLVCNALNDLAPQLSKGERLIRALYIEVGAARREN